MNLLTGKPIIWNATFKKFVNIMLILYENIPIQILSTFSEGLNVNVLPLSVTVISATVILISWLLLADIGA